MDFVALILFLALYYIRPQEWYSGFNNLRPVQLLSILAIWAMIKGKKLRPRELVVTPLDWLILCYFIWTLLAGWQPLQTASQIEAVLLFYFVAVRALDTIERQKLFLGWWCFFMIFIAALAIASLYGFDPLGSNDVTQNQMKGRLVLNLSVFDNPNSLAHSIISAIPLIYYLFYWRRVVLKFGILLMIIPLYCLFLTESKGAYLAGFVTLLATLTFGRSKIWQIVILVVAITFGYGALYALPRMTELNNSKEDPAIQGRVAAFTFGLHVMQNTWWGIGLGNWKDYFLQYGPLEKHYEVRLLPPRRPYGVDEAAGNRDLNPRRERVAVWSHYIKGTHSAYNENGAELGYPGLFLFVGILYCCVRTLVIMKCETDDEERIRRALFALVIAYAASGWMVDFFYRPTFFLFVASISALHRHFLLKEKEAEPITVEAQPLVPVLPWLRRRPPLQLPGIAIPGLPMPMAANSVLSVPLLAPAPVQSAVTVMPPAIARSGRTFPWQKEVAKISWRPKFLWSRLGIVDYLLILALTYATIQYWKHLIATI